MVPKKRDPPGAPRKPVPDPDPGPSNSQRLPIRSAHQPELESPPLPDREVKTEKYLNTNGWELIPTGLMYHKPLPMPVHELSDDAFYDYNADLGPRADDAHGDTSTTQVFTNYLKITKLPSVVHVYSITYGKRMLDDDRSAQGRPSASTQQQTSSSSSGTESVSRPKHEKARMFEQIKPLFLADFYGWASNYNQIWSVQPVRNIDELPGQETEFPKVEYRLRSGKWSKVDKITVKKTGIMQISDQQLTLNWQNDATSQHSEETTSDMSTRQSRIRALNALLLHRMRMETKGANSQASTWMRNTAVFLTEAWQQKNLLIFPRGYVLSLRPIQEGKPLLLNVNIVNTAFLPSMSVAKLYKAYVTEGANKLTEEDLGDMLQGKLLRLMYRRIANPHLDPRVEAERIVIFQGFGQEPEAQITHYTKPGSSEILEKTVARQYAQQLPNHEDLAWFIDHLGEGAVSGDMIATSKIPAVCIKTWKTVQGDKKKVFKTYVPAELLEIVPHQPITRILPPMLQESMIEYAVRKPSYNLNLIVKEGLRDLGIPEPKFITKLTNIAIHPQLMKLNGHRLQSPRLTYKFYHRASRSLKDDYNHATDASWNLRSKRFYDAAEVGKLHVVRIVKDGQTEWQPQWVQNPGHNNSCYNSAWFAQNSVNAMHSHGLLASQSVFTRNQLLPDINLPKNNDRNWEHTIAQGLDQRIQSAGGFDPMNDILLILLPGKNRSKDRPLYAAIKNATDRMMGIPAAVCALLPNKGGEADEQRISNIVLKFNFRLGHQVHDIDLGQGQPSLRNTIFHNTIVLGADVTHPSNTDPDKGTPSIAALVGTVSRDVTNYGGPMRLQRGRQEEIEDMKKMVIDRLHGWQEFNNMKLPTNVLMYRDGVGEDHMSRIYEVERNAILNAYKSLQAPQPKITYIFVTKRHNTRFYPVDSDEKHMHKNGNVKAGLLITHSITPADPPNFYLQSHHAIQGTARSAHYTIMQDDMNLTGRNMLYSITHALCYAFARATKGVSYVAPAYVADRLCERGNVYLRRWQLNKDAKLWKPGDDVGPPKKIDPKAKVKPAPQPWSELDDQQKTVATRRFAERPKSQGGYWKHDDNPSGNPWNPALNKYMFWM